jgi:hypothetical protein
MVVPKTTALPLGDTPMFAVKIYQNSGEYIENSKFLAILPRKK